MRICVAYFAKPELPLSGDPWFYYWQGFFTVHGRPFIDPFNLIFANHSVPASDHPPLTSFAEAVLDFYGLTSIFQHQIAWSFIGSITVIVIGLLARDIAGERAGILASLIACIYPGLWINDGLVESETIAQCLVAIILLLGYRHWKRPTYPLTILLGIFLGLDLMTRSEDVLLWVLLAIPLTLRARSQESSARGPLLGSVSWGHILSQPRSLTLLERIGNLWRSATTWGISGATAKRGDLMNRSFRLKLFGICFATTAIVCSPWVIHNLTTFQKTEIISTQLGRTLIGANCPQSYSGSLEGYWDYQCQLENPPPPGDQSISDTYYRDKAISFALHHKSRWIPVIYARLGRTWGFYDPIGNLGIDKYLQRPYWASVWQLIMYYLMLPSAIAGIFMLRRRKLPVLLILAPAIVVTAATIVTYGTTRFRAIAEPSIIVLAAIAELGWSTRLVGTRASKSTNENAFAQSLKRLARDAVGIPSSGNEYDDVTQTP